MYATMIKELARRPQRSRVGAVIPGMGVEMQNTLSMHVPSACKVALHVTELSHARFGCDLCSVCMCYKTTCLFNTGSHNFGTELMRILTVGQSFGWSNPMQAQRNLQA